MHPFKPLNDPLIQKLQKRWFDVPIYDWIVILYVKFYKPYYIYIILCIQTCIYYSVFVYPADGGERLNIPIYCHDAKKQKYGTIRRTLQWPLKTYKCLFDITSTGIYILYSQQMCLYSVVPYYKYYMIIIITVNSGPRAIYITRLHITWEENWILWANVRLLYTSMKKRYGRYWWLHSIIP